MGKLTNKYMIQTLESGNVLQNMSSIYTKGKGLVSHETFTCSPDLLVRYNYCHFF